MKKVIFIITLMFCLTSFKPFVAHHEVAASSFCEGFADGYCEGYKDVKGIYAICPITPICPIPEIGKGSYKGGYNTGFKQGSAYAKNN